MRRWRKDLASEANKPGQRQVGRNRVGAGGQGPRLGWAVVRLERPVCQARALP